MAGAQHAGPQAASGYELRYTAEEKQWMREHYGNEFKFLQAYQLSIYKEEDREEGKAILKALMNGSDRDAESEDEEPEDEFLAEIEADPMSHVADYHFNEAQLKAIKTHYGHSGNFMLSYGLKPFNDEDCEEAKQIAEDMTQSTNDSLQKGVVTTGSATVN